MQPMIFIYFAPNSSSKFCWHSSFNLVIVLHFCFWILVIIFIKITIQTEKNVSHSTATCEHHKRKKENENWKMPETAKGDVLKKVVFKNIHKCWSLFLKNWFQHKCFPVSIAKFWRRNWHLFWRTSAKQMLLNVVSNSNEEQHLLAKLNEMG